jgi:mono/diheme cytochrome c family protein
MKKRYIILVVAIIVFILLIVSCSPVAPPAPTPTQDIHKGKALVENRCSTCHGLALVQAAQYDRPGWESLVNRMVGKGAQLTSEQQQLAVEYLAKTYPKE